MAELIVFKRDRAEIEVEVDTDGSVEIDYRDLSGSYYQQGCRIYFTPDEFAQVVAALAASGTPEQATEEDRRREEDEIAAAHEVSRRLAAARLPEQAKDDPTELERVAKESFDEGFEAARMRVLMDGQAKDEEAEFQHRDSASEPWEDMGVDEARERLQRMVADKPEDIFIGEIRWRAVGGWTAEIWTPMDALAALAARPASPTEEERP